MITLNLPERSVLNILYCMNDAYDNCKSDKFGYEILQDKIKVKKCMCRSEGRSTKDIVDFRLDDMIKKMVR